MRKIRTQADIDRSKRKNQIIVGVVMIGLLLLSIVGYSFASGGNDGDSSKVNENGVDFFRQNGRWVAEIDLALVGHDSGEPEIFGFQNLPSEVSDVDVNVSITLGQYSGQVLYFVNPNEGVNEVLTNLGGYVLRYQESCLRQDSGESVVGGRWSEDLGNSTDCVGNLPVKDCDSNLIIFEGGNETRVYQDGSCIFIVGDSLKGTDAFLYKVLQVI